MCRRHMEKAAQRCWDRRRRPGSRRRLSPADIMETPRAQHSHCGFELAGEDVDRAARSIGAAYSDAVERDATDHNAPRAQSQETSEVSAAAHAAISPPPSDSFCTVAADLADRIATSDSGMCWPRPSWPHWLGQQSTRPSMNAAERQRKDSGQKHRNINKKPPFRGSCERL